MTSTIFRRLAATLGLLSAAAMPAQLLAATPASGTLSPSSGALSYTGGPYLVPNPTAQALGSPDCTLPMSCDDYTLTVSAAALATTRNLRIQVQWPVANADFDVYLLDASGNTVATSATGGDPETIIVPIPANGTVYKIRSAPYLPLAQTFTATIDLVAQPPAQAAFQGIAPRFVAYGSPAALGNNAGEPSYRMDWKVNKATLKHDLVNTGGVGFFQSGPNTLRVSHDDCSSPAVDTWEDVSTPFVQQFALSDPIGYVDHITGRVFSLDLIGGEGNSLMAHSDDDGDTFTPDQGGGAPAGPDHQTLGGGPFTADFALPHPLYPNAIYYCSQDVAAEAQCSLSLDGGQSFLPAVPIFDPTQCTGGIHGHVKVAPNGTVYVPNSSCSTGTGTAGVAVSRDNGQTWHDYTVPGSTGTLDPAVGVGADNTVYLGWVEAGNGSPHVAVSHDGGVTWVNNTDLGQLAGVVHSNFIVATAGDGDRAAIGFIGAPETGNPNDVNSYRGVWHMYVATTYDGGLTWSVVNATPNDPVQVGSVCTSGTTCGNDRNLLDFNDLDVDAEGRIVLGFADGCLAPACTEATASQHLPPYEESRANKAAVIRQAGGRRLFRAYDPVEPNVPAAPLLTSAVRNADGSIGVSWKTPDDRAAPLTGYNVYRGTSATTVTRIASIGPSKPFYLDQTAAPNTAYVYKVSAVNARGEGGMCRQLALSSAAVESVCTGITVATDSASNDAIDGMATHDLISAAVAYPYVSGTNDPLVFTLKAASLSSLTPRTFYFASFAVPGGKIYGVRMAVSETGKVSYFSYAAAPSGGTTPVTDGRFVDTMVPADPASSYKADGTITIVIKPSDIGVAAGQTLTGFNGGVGLDGTTPAGGFTEILDGIPDNTLAARVGSFKLDNATCRPNSAPIPVLDATPNAGPAPLAVSFSGAGSTDPDNDAIANYRFDFGDGSTPVNSATPTVSHSYANAGIYAAQLSVTDARGLSGAGVSQASIMVTSAGGGTTTNTAPTAVLAVSPNSGTVPLAVSFNAGGSSDPDSGDMIAEYAFNFGDGSPVLRQATATASHSYANVGSYSATVTVTDTHGASSSATQVITTQSAGQPAPPPAPLASLSVTPASGNIPLDVQFDASGSHDSAGGTIASYAFDFGDGSAKLVQATAKASHRYTTAGSFSASVVVTNGTGASSAPASVTVTATTTITVTPGPGSPVAALTVTPTSGAAPLTVSFDGSKSFDPSGGTIAQYTFDFGDGSAPVTQALPTITHVYVAPGSFQPTLSVANSAGRGSSAFAKASVSVQPAATGGSTGGGKGGAFGLGLLLPMSLLGLLRRRRRS